MSKITLIGIDTAKNVFHLVGIDEHRSYTYRPVSELHYLYSIPMWPSKGFASHIHVLSARASCFALPSPSLDSYREVPFILNIILGLVPDPTAVLSAG